MAEEKNYKTCPLTNTPGFVEPCSKECAWWLGEECALAALGRAAQQFMANADFEETVKLYAAKEH